MDPDLEVEPLVVKDLRSLAARKVGVVAGARFGHLIVVRKVSRPGAQNSKWIVDCDCGTRKTIQLFYLTRPLYPMRHCGCLKYAASKYAGFKRERGIWFGMHQRCYNPNAAGYKLYGGATPPIAVCKEWHKDNPQGWNNFIEFMGPCPPQYSIDRVNPFMGYQPHDLNGVVQVQWASATHQANNQKRFMSPEQRAARLFDAEAYQEALRVANEVALAAQTLEEEEV